MSTSHADERARTLLLLTVFASGTLLGVTDLMDRYAPWCPRMSSLGMLLCAVGMAFMSIRFRLFSGETAAHVVPRLALALVALLTVCGLAMRVSGIKAAGGVLVTAAVGVACFSLLRERVFGSVVRARRTGELATLGRFSAQIDHDVRNPLAALKGAAQLLKRDLGRATPALDRVAFVNLILDQVDRIEVIFARYRRLSRLELNRSDIDLNEIARSVLSRQAADLPESIALRRELTDGPLRCSADADLLATILESLTRNSVEAMPEGGTIVVRTCARSGARAGVEVGVQDTGVGMDARTLERATDDFFTTKPNGSGFGLAFAKRVAEAHGGRVTIASQVGEGTLVRLWLPARAPENEASDQVA